MKLDVAGLANFDQTEKALIEWVRVQPIKETTDFLGSLLHVASNEENQGKRQVFLLAAYGLQTLWDKVEEKEKI